ncbi:MAG: riboflavin kinase/FMN adenylyltransferase [Saprospiraceae bacterium]|jgi:riboflavin kinase/FMN adenylyltransferase
MRVFQNLATLPKFKNAVITIGSYDGVHAGHQQIIKRLNDLAKEGNGESVLITFHPHPRLVLFPNDTSLKLVTSVNEKIEVLKRYGIDNVVVVPFTKAFSEQTPLEYIQDFLVKYFQPKRIVIGYDHRFGNKRAGGIELLKELAFSFDYEVEEIRKHEVDDIAVSSTKIRNALLEGKIEKANSFLNYPFMMAGHVVHGKKIGTEIGYPTANLEVERQNKIIPKQGIYAVYVLFNDKRYKAMLYIGNRPTLNGQDQSIEVNLFDFNADLYGKTLYIEFVAHIREDAKFDSLEALKVQISKDKVATLARLV